jgi:hypothetical protein
MFSPLDTETEDFISLMLIKHLKRVPVNTLCIKNVLVLLTHPGRADPRDLPQAASAYSRTGRHW